MPRSSSFTLLGKRGELERLSAFLFEFRETVLTAVFVVTPFLTVCRVTVISFFGTTSLLGAALAVLCAVLLADEGLFLTGAAGFVDILLATDLRFRDGALLAALACVGWVRVLLLLIDGLAGTWGALAAKSKLRRREGLPVLVYIRIWAWFMPGLEFLDESDELAAGLPVDCLFGRA